MRYWISWQKICGLLSLWLLIVLGGFRWCSRNFNATFLSISRKLFGSHGADILKRHSFSRGRINDHRVTRRLDVNIARFHGEDSCFGILQDNKDIIAISFACQAFAVVILVLPCLILCKRRRKSCSGRKENCEKAFLHDIPLVQQPTLNACTVIFKSK